MTNGLSRGEQGKVCPSYIIYFDRHNMLIFRCWAGIDHNTPPSNIEYYCTVQRRTLLCQAVYGTSTPRRTQQAQNRSSYCIFTFLSVVGKCVCLYCIYTLCYLGKGSTHRVHTGVEQKQGECICPLSWSVHHNFVRDGRHSKRGWSCTPPPSPAWADFSIMMECKPESGHCHSVYSVVQRIIQDTVVLRSIPDCMCSNSHMLRRLNCTRQRPVMEFLVILYTCI